MKRRNFIKTLISVGILSQIPLGLSCSRDNKAIIIPKNEVLKPSQRNVVLFFLNKLFPENNGVPGIAELNTYQHLNNYLQDANVDIDDKNYLIKGISWIEESANETFQKEFKDLNYEQKQELFKQILKEDWGESWASRLLTLIFESLLLDPLYDVNLQQSGWNWLHHIPGNPEPDEQNHYKKLLAAKTKPEIITQISQL